MHPRIQCTVCLLAGVFILGCGNTSSSDDPAAINPSNASSTGGGCPGIEANGTCYTRCNADADCDGGLVCRDAMVNNQPAKLCGDAGTSANITTTDTTGTDANNGTMADNSGSPMMANTTGNTSSGSGGDGSDAGDMNPGNSGSDSGTMMPFGVCPDMIDFAGQLTGEAADIPNGGIFSTTAPTAEDPGFDSGLEAIVAEVPEMNEETKEGTWAVNNALIIATSYVTPQDVPRSQTSFWISDGKAAMEVRLYYEGIQPTDYPDFQVRAGQRISFTATKLSRYFSSLQIAGGMDWRLDAGNKPVYVFEPTNELGACPDSDRACEDAEQGLYMHKLVRVTGILGEFPGEGAGYTCGGSSKCWGLKYGDGSRVGILRTSSMFVETGQCVTFVGPLNYYQGKPQFNVDNFDWLRSY
ncbi:MAG: hypothetical protein VX589_12180 [Myxococcota bacterium]|nr:hypothetical protein [Myxococcota bacterium]